MRDETDDIVSADTQNARSARARALLCVSERHRSAMEAAVRAEGGTELMVCTADELSDALARFSPKLAILDAGVAMAAEHRLMPLRSEHRCFWVMLLPDLSGAALTVADKLGVDQVVSWPLLPGSLRRLLECPFADPPETPQAERNSARLPAAVIGESQAMREVWRLVVVGAQSNSSVLITGETGVGKEIVARALHRFSARRGPFVAVNCAALPPTLLESELFGHEKGAFTGANARRLGRFELANNGTIFLDEIGDLPLEVQVKLLRVLQERRIERVGGTESIEVDVRVVAATHRNLSEYMQRDLFRPDLYYRLNVLNIAVPPLRERKSDIEPMWRYFLVNGADKQKRAVPKTHPTVLRLLLQHRWPGNVRELQNLAHQALATTAGSEIMAADLPSLQPEPAASLPCPSLAGFALKEIERAAIEETLQVAGSVKAAAQMLGVSVRKLHYRLQEYRNRDEKDSSLPDVPTDSRRLRVLLAEDDDDLRWILQDFLTSEGYEVIGVSDGHELLEHLGAAMLLEGREAPPDVIISDLRMPGITGMQLLESARALQWTIPFIIISAFGDSETRARARDLGATAFLEKPLKIQRLQEVLLQTVPN